MHNHPTILVVEDDPNLLEGIRDILEIQGYQVLTAANGADGLGLLQRSEMPPDLIVSDIMMPEMDGYQLLEAIRKEKAWLNIPFIFLTARGEKHDIRTGKSLGVDDYLVKPFDADELVVVAAAKLRRYRELAHLHTDQIADLKKRILTILHHEFRTPLSYVVAYSDMLHNDTDTLTYEEMKQFLSGVSSGANRLRHLVENFILLVELETGEAQETFQWRKRRVNNVAALVEQAMETTRPFAESRGVKLMLEPLPDSLPDIVGDQEFLKAVAVRLLDNAIKFSDKADSAVQVKVYSQDNYLWLSVIDHGRGIPVHERDAIFDIFYQINRQVYEDQGAGAGLPIVQRIVEMHGGCVQVRSRLGEGSEFLVGLPVATK